MTTSPLVTIFVATFNRADLLAITLQSILLQDFQDYEVWVMGDGCTDHSGEVVAAIGDARFQWYNLPKNHKSPYIAYNEGFRRAKGQYIAYLEHDDLWFPDYLSTMLKTIKEQKVDVVKAMLVYYKNNGVVHCKGEILDRYLWFPEHPSITIHSRKIIDDNVLWGNPYEVGQSADSYFFQLLYDKGYTHYYLKDFLGILFSSYTFQIYQAKQFIQKDFLEKIKNIEDLQSLKYAILLDCANSMNTVLYQKLDVKIIPTIKYTISKCIDSLFRKYSKIKLIDNMRVWLYLRTRKKGYVSRGIHFNTPAKNK